MRRVSDHDAGRWALAVYGVVVGIGGAGTRIASGVATPVLSRVMTGWWRRWTAGRRCQRRRPGDAAVSGTDGA